jgi:hypothetical protein
MILIWYPRINFISAALIGLKLHDNKKVQNPN